MSRDIDIDIEDQEFLAKQDEGCGSRTAPGEIKGFPLQLVIPASEFTSLPIKPKEDAVEGVACIPGLGMIVGPRGLGKTRCAGHLMDAITRGRKFLGWETRRARRFLYIDGELPASDLQGVVRDHCGPEPSSLLDLISSEFFYGTEQEPLTLNNPIHQQRFLKLLEDLKIIGRKPEVLLFDNLSSMTYGTEENSNSEQDSFLRFLVNLRHRGYLVIFIHHTGNSGQQRGASRREDFLDFVIRLSAPEKSSPHGNAKFVLEFSKMRRKMPTPSSLECELVSSERGLLEWLCTPLDREVEVWVECLRQIQMMMPGSQDDLATALGIGKSTISKHLKKARDKDLLDGMRLTDSGRRYLGAIYGRIEGED